MREWARDKIMIIKDIARLMLGKYYYLIIALIITTFVVAYKSKENPIKENIRNLPNITYEGIIDTKYKISDNSELTLELNDSNTIATLNKSKCKEYNISEIIFNNTIVKDKNPITDYYYTETNDKLIIKSKYSLKPSQNTLEFIGNLGRKKINLSLVYSSGTNVNNNFWKQIPLGAVKSEPSGMLLKPDINKKMTQLMFSRGFIKNVKMEFDLNSVKQPLLVGIYFNDGTTIYMGVNDKKSIQLIQAKKIKNRISNKIEQPGIYKEGFKSGIDYKIVVTRNADTYTATIINKITGSEQQVINYTDATPATTIQSKFMGIGLGVMTGSGGVLIKNIRISSTENI